MEAKAKPAKTKFVCGDCGKGFIDNHHLERHKRRKIPCLIRDINIEDQKNPCRCIYCNRVLTCAGSLKRHLVRCKVKNGKAHIGNEKIRHEQQIRVLTERLEQTDTRFQELDATNKLLLEKVEKLEKQQPTTVHNDIHHGDRITNNINVDNSITINFHNVNAPKVDTLMGMTQDDFLVENITKKLMVDVFFNAEIPENHIVLMPNIKERDRLLVHTEDMWKTVIGNGTTPVFTSMLNAVRKVGNQVMNKNKWNDDAPFLALYPVVQNAIIAYNANQTLTHEEITEIIIANREITETTYNKFAKKAAKREGTANPLPRSSGDTSSHQ